jgi:disulfide bond formation protein DsbB
MQFKNKNLLLNPSLISLILAIFALLFALYLQYFQSYLPCHLCILQRYGYLGTILISLIGLFIYSHKIIPVLLCLSFILISSISFWHMGVELQWWAASLECSGMTEDIGGLKEELENIKKYTPTAACDQKSPIILGISLVQWSFVYGLVSVIILSILIINHSIKRDN